jgi:hypothetical protein
MGLGGYLRDVLHRTKDAGTSFLASQKLASLLEPYGRMLNFSIDSQLKSIHLEVLLKGESSPISIMVRDYEIREKEGRMYITARRVDASREWVKALLQDFVQGKEVAIPPKLQNMLKLVL